MGVIIAIASQKGGCGKTTTAVHLGQALAARGERVLLIDLDPQGHAGDSLGAIPDEDSPPLAEVLAHSPLTGVGPRLDQCLIASRPGLDVVPSTLALGTLETRLAPIPGREERLAEHLGEFVQGWDVILIDTPPNLGLLTVNALVAASECLVPLPPSPFALQGAERLLETLDMIEAMIEHEVTTRFLPVMAPVRDRYAAEIRRQARQRWDDRVLEVSIRRSVLFARAAARGRTAGELDPRSKAWLDYVEAASRLADTWNRSLAASPTRFSGLRVVPDGVCFSHSELRPEEIQLAGDFNGWRPDAGVQLKTLGRRGWLKFLHVPPGKYEYKFLIRDRWSPDPINPRQVFSPLGTENSVIEVPPARPPEDRSQPPAARP